MGLRIVVFIMLSGWCCVGGGIELFIMVKILEYCRLLLGCFCY